MQVQRVPTGSSVWYERLSLTDSDHCFLSWESQQSNHLWSVWTKFVWMTHWAIKVLVFLKTRGKLSLDIILLRASTSADVQLTIFSKMQGIVFLFRMKDVAPKLYIKSICQRLTQQMWIVIISLPARLSSLMAPGWAINSPALFLSFWAISTNHPVAWLDLWLLMSNLMKSWCDEELLQPIYF